MLYVNYADRKSYLPTSPLPARPQGHARHRVQEVRSHFGHFQGQAPATPPGFAQPWLPRRRKERQKVCGQKNCVASWCVVTLCGLLAYIMWFLAVILEVQETCGDAVSFFERKHGRRAGLESDLYTYTYKLKLRTWQHIVIAHGHATKAILRENSQAKCRRPRLRPTFCVSLRSRNALGHVTRAILCENLKEKYRRPHLRPTFCASLRNRKASLCENLQVKCIKMPQTTSHAYVLRAQSKCAWTCWDMSDKQFYARILRQNAADQDRDPPLVRAYECHKNHIMREFTGNTHTV